MSTKRMERVFPLLMTVLMIATAFIPAVSAAEPNTSNVDTTSWINTSAEIESAGEPGADTSPATDSTRVVTGSGKIRLKTYDPETRTIRITDEGRSAADGDLEIRLVNTTPDLGTFTEIFEITAHSTIALDESEDFRATWALHNGEENVTRAEWFVWENRLHTVKIPIIEYRNVTLEINTSENRTFENVTRGETLPETATVREPYIAGTETRERYWYEWVPFDPAGQTLNAEEARTFKVVYTKPAEIGQVDINTAPVFRGVACPEMTWWSTAWTARVPITIINPPAVDNYSHCEVVSFLPGMQSDFDDVRFATDDGTVLDYWKESYTASDSAVIWVNLPAGVTLIWMYYGNAAATDTGSRDNAYILYDDFNGPDLDTTIWTDTHPDGHYISNGWIYDVRTQETGIRGVLVSNDNVIANGEPVIVEMHIHADGLASPGYCSGYLPIFIDHIDHDSAIRNGLLWYKQSSNWCRYVLVNGVASWRPGASRGLAVGGDYYNTWIITPSSQTHTVSGSASYTDVFAGTTGISNHRMVILGGDNSVSGRVMRMDWIRARKYVETEPTFAYGTPEFEPPVANFTASPITGAAPLTVQFTDTSTGSPTSWAWDFTNDGSWDSYAQNPSYTYNNPGTYSVKLRATNADGDDEEVKTDVITVTAPIYYVYAEAGDSGTSVYNMAKGFWETIKDAQSGWTTWRDWRNEDDIIKSDSSREGHWRKTAANPPGHADQWVERADFAYFTGHGFPNGFLFEEPDEDSNLTEAHAQNISLGSGRTKWVVLDSCSSLNESSQTNWHASFNGLRMLLGWDSPTTPTNIPIGRGEMFAKLMMGQYPDPTASELSIFEAWTWAAVYTWEGYSPGEDIYTAIIYDTNCLNDMLPGWGGYSTSPSGFLEYNKTLVKNVNEGKDVEKSTMLDSTNGRYSIHTSVPTTSGKLMTYISEKPEYTEEWVSSLARNLGMSGKKRESEKAYYADETEEDEFYFVVQKDAKIIAFKKYHQQSGEPLSAETATESVHEFLENAGLMFPDATDANIGYNTGESISPSGERVQTWKQIVVTFPRELNGLRVWDSQILADVDPQGNVVRLFISWPDYKPHKEVSLKTPEQAFEEFQKEFASIHGEKAEKVIVTDVSLGYSSLPISGTQRCLQPTYVFEGSVQRGSLTDEFEPIIIEASGEGVDIA
ncbi:MAG: hypothetical protein PWR21_431 [Methanoculleus sp.]|nr:hypothetical protein [Methanoculleus sp.]MDK2988784.1 hypothetical protein [Methanoculleus sp.]